MNLNIKQRILFGLGARPDVKYPITIVDNTTGPNVTPIIDLLKENKDYVFTVPLSRLTIKQIEFGALTTSIVFTSASDAMTLDYPSDLLWINDEIPEIEANTSYLILICNNIAVINKLQTLNENE